MYTVAKFGGSSVKNAQAIERCAEIIAHDPSVGLVVVSATYQTTNKLESLDRETLDSLYKHHKNMAFYLSLDAEIHEEMASLYNYGLAKLQEFEGMEKLSLKQQDELYLIGELWSSWLFYGAIKKVTNRNIQWIDAREYIITDSEFGLATPNQFKIDEKISSLNKTNLYITQGFIGADENNTPTTLGREGSDYSASLFASALNADQVIIWTDVCGIASIDPKVDEKAKFISELSYEKASCLALNGAKVLFPKTLAPLKDKGIPAFIKSSLDPGGPFTKISQESLDQARLCAVDEKKSTITLVGNDLDKINGIEYEEVSRNEISRTFSVEEENLFKVARDLHGLYCI